MNNTFDTIIIVNNHYPITWLVPIKISSAILNLHPLFLNLYFTIVIIGFLNILDDSPKKSKQKLYHCEDCGKTLMSRQSFWSHRHFLCVNKKNEKFKCPYCNHSTNLKTNLKTHMVTKHAGQALEPL